LIAGSIVFNLQKARFWSFLDSSARFQASLASASQALCASTDCSLTSLLCVCDERELYMRSRCDVDNYSHLSITFDSACGFKASFSATILTKLPLSVSL